MKKLIFLFLFLPSVLNAQKVIVLSSNQSPEFGFSVTKTDTTIINGSSIILAKNLAVFGGKGDYLYSWSPIVAIDNPTILNPTVSPTDTTVYTITVVDKTGCSFSVNYKVNVRNALVDSDIVEDSNGLTAVLYPNPNDGKFKLKLTGKPSTKIEIVVFDASGKKVKQQIIRNFSGEQTETIQLKLAGGIYNLLVRSNNESLNQQFVIN